MSEKDEEMTVDGSEQDPTLDKNRDSEESSSNKKTDAEAEEQEEPVEEEPTEVLDPMEQLEQQAQSEKDKYMRLYAEFENFRRRTAKERMELLGSATGDIMKEIIPILDDFDRAIESNKEVKNIDAVKAGFELLHNKLYRLLSNKGLKPMETKGKDFDPEVHEAVAQIPAPSDKEKGKVIDVVEKGYELNDKILRHPKVVVGQ